MAKAKQTIKLKVHKGSTPTIGQMQTTNGKVKTNVRAKVHKKK